MKKIALSIFLIALLYLTAHTQTSTNNKTTKVAIDTVPAILIICDSVISNNGQTTNYYKYTNVMPVKYSSQKKSLVTIDGYVIQELKTNDYAETSMDLGAPTVVYRYLNKDMQVVNNKWVFQWKTK